MALPTASDNPFASLLITEGSAPASPAAGKRRLYVLSSDHLPYLKDSSGTVVSLAGLTDPMTTRGDIIVRNASNVTARLGRGSASQVLTSDGTDVAWAAAASGGNSSHFVLYGWDSGGITSTTGTYLWNTANWTDMGVAGPYGNGWGWYNSTHAQNDQLTWTLFFAAGTYSITLRGRKSSNLGIITVKIAGSSVGTADFYAASPAYLSTTITGAVVAAGSNTFQIIVATKNASSTDYYMNLFDIMIERTA